MHRRFFVLLICGLAAFAPRSFAVAIGGNLLGAGVGPVNFSNTVIDFTTPVNPLGNGTGTFDILAGSTGSFAALAGANAASIRDLNSATVPAGVPVAYSNFVTFAAQPTWSITLTLLLPGSFSSAECGLPAAAGQVCTPAGSPFEFVNTTATSSTVTFSFLGDA